MKQLAITILSTFILAISSPLASSAQHNHKVSRQQWYHNMVQTKIDYLAKQMDLNADQKAKFEKHYVAMSNETSKLANETRSLERSVSKKENATDLEFEKAAEAVAEFKSKEGAIEMRYFNQFKSYLTKKQLFKLKVAEHTWMKELMRQRGKSKK